MVYYFRENSSRWHYWLAKLYLTIKGTVADKR
jgi:hypothetical protein